MKEKIINILKLLFCFGLFMYISSFLGIVLGFFDININDLSIFYKTLLNLGIAILMSIMSTIIYRKELVKYFNEFKINWKSKVLFALKLFGIFILIKLLASYVSSFLAIIFNIEDITSENQTTLNDLLGQFPVLMSFSAIILAPFYEEMLFRLGFKKCISNRKTFIIISGTLFGLVHIFPTDLNLSVALIQSIPYVTMGLCLTYYYDKYDNIFYSILVHFYNNLFGVIIILLSFFINLI